jgi:hypothetical protein
MIMLSRNGSMKLDISSDGISGRSKAIIDLPAELTGQQTDLYDRVFAFAFDVLGIQTVELRVRPADERARTLSAPARLAFRERSA